MANQAIYLDQDSLKPESWNFTPSNLTTKSPVINCTLNVDVMTPREDSWVIPLVVLSTLNVAAIISFEVYVLYKSCGSRRHLFLGQILLFGLFLSSIMGYVFVPTPHWFTCAVTRTGVGVAYVIVFATLLVKCVFLLSLHVGVYLSAAYQGLLLFFAVAVQIAVSVQWLAYDPPRVIAAIDTVACYATCATRTSDTVVSLTYSMFLMVGVVVLAIRARTVPENHGESLYIGTAIGLSVPIWVSWLLASWVVHPRYHDACIAFGVVITATVVFLVMFLPKGRQLASMSRDGLYSEDCFSSINQSVYTPSFLHLKPPFVKQGTLIKPLTATFTPHQERSNFFLPPPNASRLWRYSHHPAAIQFHPTHEDIYWPNDRYMYAPAGVKLYRSPLY